MGIFGPEYRDENTSMVADDVRNQRSDAHDKGHLALPMLQTQVVTLHMMFQSTDRRHCQEGTREQVTDFSSQEVRATILQRAAQQPDTWKHNASTENNEHGFGDVVQTARHLRVERGELCGRERVARVNVGAHHANACENHGVDEPGQFFAPGSHSDQHHQERTRIQQYITIEALASIQAAPEAHGQRKNYSHGSKQKRREYVRIRTVVVELLVKFVHAHMFTMCGQQRSTHVLSCFSVRWMFSFGHSRKQRG
mmetsp:Transcript_40797/g.102687  ORF Transcript_40797/g.102687 Transcript_40797/m.102687 type:complete len:253 (+) Transcript_40797:2395-3153(+)